MGKAEKIGSCDLIKKSDCRFTETGDLIYKNNSRFKLYPRLDIIHEYNQFENVDYLYLKTAFDSCYPKLNDDFKNKTPFIFGTAGEIFNEMDFVKNKAAYFFDQSLNKISILPNKEFLSKEQIVKIYDKLWKTNYLKPLQ